MFDHLDSYCHEFDTGERTLVDLTADDEPAIACNVQRLTSSPHAAKSATTTTTTTTTKPTRRRERPSKPNNAAIISNPSQGPKFRVSTGRDDFGFAKECRDTVPELFNRLWWTNDGRFAIGMQCQPAVLAELMDQVIDAVVVCTTGKDLNLMQLVMEFLRTAPRYDVHLSLSANTTQKISTHPCRLQEVFRLHPLLRQRVYHNCVDSGIVQLKSVVYRMILYILDAFIKKQREFTLVL